jgi:ribosomal protein L5
VSDPNAIKHLVKSAKLWVGIFTDKHRYPPHMIPGCHITVHTTAKTDKEARLLLTAVGIPFFGKLVN